MRINQPSVCGSLESSDILIRLSPTENGIEVRLHSIVQTQFGDAIEAVIRQVLTEANVENACVDAMDRGALDCTIRARMEVAVARAFGEVML